MIKKKAAVFLDSIPLPLSENIKGHLSCFYEIKVLINDKNQETAKLYQNSKLALKYAENDKNYEIVGWASFELFYNSFFVKKTQVCINTWKTLKSITSLVITLVKK
ncbi:MAG: hypothetical protein ABJM36_05755 [Algibacter sp.]|uniref:hypothetical protein n=1 Tax=Algibacter sp. TaxID=1872428 RepID=UPI0032980344